MRAWCAEACIAWEIKRSRNAYAHSPLQPCSSCQRRWFSFRLAREVPRYARHSSKRTAHSSANDCRLYAKPDGERTHTERRRTASVQAGSSIARPKWSLA